MQNPQTNSGSNWTERFKQVNRNFKDVLQSSTGQHVLALLQAELGRMGGPTSLTPNQAQTLSTRINQALGQLIAAFAAPRNPLEWWGNRHPLRLEMALHRMAGITAQLEAVTTEYNALTRGRLQLGSNGRVGTESGETQTNRLPAVTPRRPSQAQCRRVAEGIRQLGVEAVAAARDIQASISGAHGTNPFDVTGAVAELVVLASWLRQAQGALQAELWGTTNAASQE